VIHLRKVKFFPLLLAAVAVFFLAVIGQSAEASIADRQTMLIKSLSPELQKFLRENVSASKYLNNILAVQLSVRSIEIQYTNDSPGPTARHYCPKPDVAVIELSSHREPIDEYLSLVFELFNSSHEEEFRKVLDEASAKKISKRDFIRQLVRIEFESCLKVRSDLPLLHFSAKDIASSQSYENYLNTPDTFEDHFLEVKNVGDEWSPARDYGQMYDSLIGRDLTNAYSLAHEGILLVQEEKWTEAIKKLTDAIALNPDDATALYHLGRACAENGDTNAALKYLAQSIRADSELARSYATRARIYRGLGKFNEAIMDHREAIRLSKKDVHIRNGLSWTYLMMGDRTKAFAQFQMAINLNPKDSEGYVDRAEAFIEINDWAAAIKDFADGFRIHPKNMNALDNLAWLQACCPNAACRDGDKALANARNACEVLGWTNGTSLSVLAAACAEKGEFAEAIKWQQKAIAVGGAIMETNAQGLNPLQTYQAKKPWRVDVRKPKGRSEKNAGG
jgi:tetratricopeptide (TPR) repeat protein